MDIEKPEDLKPGDLVFVSGIYHNPKCKFKLNSNPPNMDTKGRGVHVIKWSKLRGGSEYMKVDVSETTRTVCKREVSMLRLCLQGRV